LIFFAKDEESLKKQQKKKDRKKERKKKETKKYKLIHILHNKKLHPKAKEELH
jgi:hypothetical protein